MTEKWFYKFNFSSGVRTLIINNNKFDDQMCITPILVVVSTDIKLLRIPVNTRNYAIIIIVILF